jgi:hypothetical protein
VVFLAAQVEVGRQLEANAGATIMEGEGLIIIDRTYCRP